MPEWEVAHDNPWEVAEQPGYVEDMAKVTAPALTKGVLGVVGAPGDLAEVGKVVADKAPNPFGWLSDTKAGELFKSGKDWLKQKSAETLAKPGIGAGMANSGDSMGGGNIELPTSAGMQKKIETVTGPFYEAKTGPGKALSTGLEVAPALATGPVGGLRGLMAKSAGAGIASELAGEGAAAVKDKLPESAQPWAEPIARGVGMIGGTFTPAGVRKAVTPLPMSDEQHAIVEALKKTDPAFVDAATAGQLTQSPSLLRAEARAVPGQVEKQAAAFTEATNARSADTGKAIGKIYENNSIPSQHFADLNTAVAQEKRKLGAITGTSTAQDVLGEIQKDIKMGASNNATVSSMTGKRYQYLRDRLQGMIDGEGNNAVKNSLTNTKKALDSAFDKSIPNAAELADLRRQKQTFEALQNRTPNMTGEMTPQSVLQAAAHAEGNKAVNTGRSPLANWARDADQLMTPHPPIPEKTPPWFDLLSSTAGALASTGHGAGGAEGGVFGHLLKDSLYQIAANNASKVMASTPVQKALGNQLWRPGPSSAAPSKEELVRLLMSPESRSQ